MIAKVTKGRRAGGALRYDFGPGHQEEHVDPRIVAGSVPGTPQQVARIIDRHSRQRPDVDRPIWRCSLSLPDEDGILSDEKWAQIAEQYVGRMWGADVPWVAVRHGDNHIHLTVSRIQWSGELASDSHDYRKSRGIVRELEREHGLVNAEERSNRVAPQVSGPERAAAQRRGAERPEREQLRDLVRAARDASAGQGRLAFERALTEAGVSFRANTAKTGRMSGYSFSLPGWTDKEGGQVWSAASRVARDLRWADLGRTLGQPDPRVTWAAPAQSADATATSQPPPVNQESQAAAVGARTLPRPPQNAGTPGVAAAAARSRSTTRTTRPKPGQQPPGRPAGTPAVPPQQQPGQGRGR